MYNKKYINYNKFKIIKDLTLEGFSLYDKFKEYKHWFIKDSSAQNQFNEFVDKVISSRGRKYLPIYRMADGEFSFLINPIPSKITAEIPFRQRLSEYRTNIMHRLKIVDFQTCWGEKYKHNSLNIIRKKLTRDIRQIANSGYIAPYFTIRQDHWGEQYFKPVCNWFDKNSIDINEHNYIPFYFVYALLNGPVRKKLLKNINILIITSLSESKMRLISEGLNKDGVNSVQFYNIQPYDAMNENIDIRKIKGQVDLVLIAGGIGSANIINQLYSINAPCIDCGITLEAYVNFNHRYQRAFLLEDEMYKLELSKCK